MLSIHRKNNPDPWVLADIVVVLTLCVIHKIWYIMFCCLIWQELDIIYRIPHCVPISAHHKWNFDDLLEKMWSYLKLVRMWVVALICLPLSVIVSLWDFQWGCVVFVIGAGLISFLMLVANLLKGLDLHSRSVYFSWGLCGEIAVTRRILNACMFNL